MAVARQLKVKRIALGSLLLLVLAFAIAGFLRTSSDLLASHQLIAMPGSSMEPTLVPTSIHRVDKTAYRNASPQVGDIVVFKPPSHALLPDQKDAVFIQRCVGVAGEVIEIRAEKLFRNGREVSESYGGTKPARDFKLVLFKGAAFPVSIEGELANFDYASAPPYVLEKTEDMDSVIKLPPIPVPADHILIMGDNRAGAWDSRSWGPLPVKNVVGSSTS